MGVERSRRCCVSGRFAPVAAAMVGVCVLAGDALAITHLKRGSESPAIVLREVGGDEVSTAKLRGHILVLVFGEVYQDKTRQACVELGVVLRDERLKEQGIVPVLITTVRVTAEEVRAYSAENLPSKILHDGDRRAFGAYEVAVMPSVVVVDKEGRVVQAIAGLSGRFGDVITDALLVAGGKLSVERFEQLLAGQPTTAPSEESVRGDRMALLARQLAGRGLDEMAMEKYEEALKLDGRRVSAHQELGMLLLKHRRLSEAEKEFQTVLGEDPKSLQATLGLGYVQTLRGGAELAEAERRVRDVLERNPSLARAHYLLGLIQEQKEKAKDAAASFKKAAQLLLERSQQE